MFLPIAARVVVADQIGFFEQPPLLCSFQVNGNMCFAVSIKTMFLVMVIETLAQIARLSDVKNVVIAVWRLLEHKVDSTKGPECCPPGINAELVLLTRFSCCCDRFSWCHKASMRIAAELDRQQQTKYVDGSNATQLRLMSGLSCLAVVAKSPSPSARGFLFLGRILALLIMVKSKIVFYEKYQLYSRVSVEGGNAWFMHLPTQQLAQQRFYFDILLYGAVLVLLRNFLSSFFSGIGHTQVVIFSALTAMVVNVGAN